MLITAARNALDILKWRGDMATKVIKGTKVVFSNSNAATSETEYTSDQSLNTVQYFNVLSADPASASLWSVGTSVIGASGWTVQGSISVPTELLTQDTAYSIDNGTYQSVLGANV